MNTQKKIPGSLSSPSLCRILLPFSSSTVFWVLMDPVGAFESLVKDHHSAIPESLLEFLRHRGSPEGGDDPRACHRMPQPSTASRACPT